MIVAAGRITLIDALIEDQQRLTAVEQFSALHDLAGHAPAGGRYRDLLPASPPAAGEQYAFEVDLDTCSGCKACVAACHSLNGLDDDETWRHVGLLVSDPRSRPGSRSPAVVQHVTAACHHCVDPACLNGCPVLAYEKEPATGIVRHLDDQCIGCQYCVLKCPYDAPRYNSRLGIVRKCDMCSSRLAAGEAPACAQACPNDAIRITTVSTEAVRIEFRERGAMFLAGAPEGQGTLPATRYVTAGGFASHRSVVAADDAVLRPQPGHGPLVFMLVLSQAALGLTAFGLAAGPRALLLLAFAALSASMVASVFHLGRPLGAWRFFLGLRRSWLSREILCFGIYFFLFAGAVFLRVGLAPAVVAGFAAVACSVMIYHDTARPLWNWRHSGPLFAGTAALLGSAGAAMFLPGLSGLVAACAAAKLALELTILRHGQDDTMTPLKKTALLVTRHFQPVAWGRLVCLLAGGIALPLLADLCAMAGRPPVFAAAFSLLLAGECLERSLFFRAVDAPKMPGGMPA